MRLRLRYKGRYKKYKNIVGVLCKIYYILVLILLYASSRVKIFAPNHAKFKLEYLK